MKLLQYIIASLFLLLASHSFTQNAPITTIGSYTGNDETITIPITVVDFVDIGSSNLKIVYDASVATAISVTKGPLLAGSLVSNLTNPGIILIGWYTVPVITLTDSSVVFNLQFNKVSSGNSAIAFIDDGFSCYWHSTPEIGFLNDIPQSTYYIDGSIDFGTKISVKAFLEGPFDVEDMNTNLNDQGLLPLNHPYGSLPWNYQGDENLNTIPEGMVDWVLIEVRETEGNVYTATPDKTITRQAALLMDDGGLESINEQEYLMIDQEIDNNLFIIVYHRNHLPVMSAFPMEWDYDAYSYDFTDAESKALGGVSGHKEIANGIYAMVAADGNANYLIENQDYFNVWKANAGTEGYEAGDYNLNGLVANQDYYEYWQINAGREAQVIE